MSKLVESAENLLTSHSGQESLFCPFRRLVFGASVFGAQVGNLPRLQYGKAVVALLLLSICDTQVLKENRDIAKTLLLYSGGGFWGVWGYIALGKSKRKISQSLFKRCQETPRKRGLNKGPRKVSSSSAAIGSSNMSNEEALVS
ncbi:hypothetical protein SDJN03_16075, partial [Cucurbita argyrosperma subsp. sororia]